MSPSAQRPKIVVLGGINMDLAATAARMPAPGETLIGEAFLTYPGGKGANQAVAAARLGASVRMVGRVGCDTFGPVLLEGLRREGIDVSGVAEDPERPSGVAMILLDADRQNYIVAVYGANMACDGVQVRAVEQALHDADVLMLQLETPLETSLAAASLAREMGVRVVWDPAPAVALSAEAYAACDVLTPNQVEAEFLVGVKVTDAASAEAAAEKLLALGANTVVVKLGEDGAYLASRDERGFVPPFPVQVEDTVAAGDAFAGALAVALSQGSTMTEAVRYGCAAGALAVTRSGAQDAMPTRAEVDALVQG
jgi:ribokinase